MPARSLIDVDVFFFRARDEDRAVLAWARLGFLKRGVCMHTRIARVAGFVKKLANED